MQTVHCEYREVSTQTADVQTRSEGVHALDTDSEDETDYATTKGVLMDTADQQPELMKRHVCLCFIIVHQVICTLICRAW